MGSFEEKSKRQRRLSQKRAHKGQKHGKARRRPRQEPDDDALDCREIIRRETWKVPDWLDDIE